MPNLSDAPRMMAIGDSMYQGVRSLTFTKELGLFSPPAQVARRLHIPFVTPDPERPLLFDLEAILRAGNLLALPSTIRNTAVANVGAWLAEAQWSQHQVFDNVAFGGAIIESLYKDTYEAYLPQVIKLANGLKAAPGFEPGILGPLWYALGVCFTLNPQRRDEQAGLTQLDQVARRRPEILLVNIGSNEGLFNAAFLGAIPDDDDAVKATVAKMRELAHRLKELPSAVERIVFNSLVRPRTASNLTSPVQDVFPAPVEAGYFDRYAPRIGPNVLIPGDAVKAYDDRIAQANQAIESDMKAIVGRRLTFVDLYAASTAFDGKHFAKRYLEVFPNGADAAGLRLRNQPLMATAGMFDLGGLTGLDNMHPSVPGYALIADAVLRAMGSQLTTDKEQAYRQDTLLNGIPKALTLFGAVLTLLGLFGVFSGDDGLT